MQTRRSFLSFSVALGAALSLARPAAAAAPVKFADLYVSGLGLTDRARELTGAEVEIVGFMAPPLKAEASFFVLTLQPMGICPFCDSEATWPEGIVVVETGGPFDIHRYDHPLTVWGQLETGFKVDKTTGFGSLIRIAAAGYRPF